MPRPQRCGPARGGLGTAENMRGSLHRIRLRRIGIAARAQPRGTLDDSRSEQRMSCRRTHRAFGVEVGGRVPCRVPDMHHGNLTPPALHHAYRRLVPDLRVLTAGDPCPVPGGTPNGRRAVVRRTANSEQRTALSRRRRGRRGSCRGGRCGSPKRKHFGEWLRTCREQVSAPLRLCASAIEQFAVRSSRFAVRGSWFVVRSLPAASLTATMESRRRRGRRGSCRTGRCGSPKERILGNGSALAESRPLRPCASAPLR